MVVELIWKVHQFMHQQDEYALSLKSFEYWTNQFKVGRNTIEVERIPVLKPLLNGRPAYR